jgi:regulator of sigma E protease
LDSNANAGSHEPVNPVAPSDISNPGPINPMTGHPDHGAEVSALKTWFKDNMTSLIITAVVVALVIIYLDPIDTLKVVIGLGLVIFIHELGHFLAAKWCDVHVKTFSIGFGPAVPFCSYKWGETTYMVGIIPLGGYVSMVGEGDNAGDEDAEEDPRSFRKKGVGQRMLIISAGVVMNVILGMACFVAAYLHGVQEKPAIVGYVESGGAAWRAGMHTNDEITRIDNRDKPYFNDIRPIVMATQKDEEVKLYVKERSEPFSVYPLKDEGVRFPQVGIAPPYRLTLLAIKKKGFKPVIPGSKADEAAEDGGFAPGDQLIGMTDPENQSRITTLADINDYYHRMERLAGKPITIRVERKDKNGETAEMTVQPSYRVATGARMSMGEVAALRVDGPAARAGVKARVEAPAAAGDRIAVVKLPEVDGRQTWFATGDLKDQPNVTVRKLDPVLLPLELKKWAERNPDNKTVRLVVLRRVELKENEPVEVELNYDPTYQHDRELISLPNSPVPLSGLGLAYWVDAVVDEVSPGGPAALAKTAPGELPGGLHHRIARFLGLESREVPPGGEAMPLLKNDIITAVRFSSLDFDGSIKTGDWEELKPHQWASVDAAFQNRPPQQIDLKIKRGEAEIVVRLEGRTDANWPTDDRGLIFQQDFRTQKATDIADALNLGGRRTVRFIKEVYMNLYAMIFGRVSAKTMSGPLTIANVSYRFAGEDFWQFLLFIGMISVNLAVVNFLPIPVLDGGHMVFLILEKILGRPVPERVFAFAMYLGLAMILSLMIFVITLDIRRLFFGWF